MDARSRRVLAWIEYFVTIAVVIGLITLAYRLPAGGGVFFAIIAIGMAAFLVYRMVTRQTQAADWTDKHPRRIITVPLRSHCISCGYDCSNIYVPICPECGKPHALPRPQLSLKERNTICAKCSFQFPEIAGRCPECGYLVRDPLPAEAPVRFRVRTLLAGVISFTLLVAGLCIAAFVGNSRDGRLVSFLLVPAWMAVMVVAGVIVAIGAALRRDLTTVCGVLLLAITGLGLFLIVATLTF